MRLRKYLKDNGIRIDFFAKKLGIKYVTLYMYMSGKLKTPKSVKLATRQLTGNLVTQVRDKIKDKIKEEIKDEKMMLDFIEQSHVKSK